jgi:hypothetical protein
MKTHLDNGTKKLRGGKGSEQATKELEDECFALCLKADETLRSTGEKEHTNVAAEELAQDGSILPTTRPIVFSQLITGIPNKEGAQTPAETLRLVASELLDNLEAARVGMGINVTYATYRLSQRPDLQAKLRAELAPLSLPPHGPLSSAALREMNALPLLDAIVTETLRAHPAAPGPQYREVPAGGVVVDGHLLPGGTWVSASPYVLHRHAGAFPDAEEWRPERWMAGPGDEGGKAAEGEDDPKKWFFAFGKGGRMCVGSNFAIVGMFSALRRGNLGPPAVPG